jgi:hexosaminidase
MFRAILLSTLALAVATPSWGAPPALLPAPKAIEERSGGFRLDRQIRIAADPADKGAVNAAERLAELLVRAGRQSIEVQRASGSISFVRAPGLGAEAYRLRVDSNGATVTASADAGLYYGAVTLWQLASGAESDLMPAVTIEDAPRYPWRGLMLDSARHYQSPAFIKRFIEWMAVNKLNRFHWHLVDDQGWRLEIRKYPRLTQIGGWRSPAKAPGAPKLPRTGGFYTQAEVREIVAFAAARGITVVPEIELPGHALSAIRAYPGLGTGVPIPAGVESHWGVFPWLYNVDETAISFLEDVLAEVLELFPSAEIHLGGDEAVKDQWRASPDIQATIKRLGLKDENALQGWLMSRMARYLAARGRRMVGWDEILDADLPPGAIVMSWRGTEGALKATQAGHDTILAAAPTLYFDHRQSNSPAEPPGRGKIISLKDVLAFRPTPEGLSDKERAHVLGLQAQIWTEHIRTEERVAWMAFPRALAVAETGWSGEARYDDFTRRLLPQLARMSALGLTAASSSFSSAGQPAPDLRYSTDLQTCSGKIDLYLEDDFPAGDKRPKFLIDILNPCWIWKQAELGGMAAIEIDVGQLPFNFQVGADRDAIRFRAPRSDAGEFEVRAGGCDGHLIAQLPLAPARSHPGVTRLRAALVGAQGTQDLCFTYTARGPDPLWAIERIRLVR